MNLACLVGIMVVTATQDTGLSEDMLGLAGHAGLILDKKPSDLGFEVTDDEATFSKVCTKLFEQRFHISEENGSGRAPLASNLTKLQSFFDLLEHNVRSLAALDALRQGYCSPAVLWDDYTTGTPVAEVFSAFHRGQHLLDYVLLASFTSYIYTVMLGSLQVSASYCGSTTYGGDLAGVIIVLATNSFILAVSLAIAWRYGRATFLPRFPNVMASVLPYVLSSELLRRDLRAVRGKGRTGEKVKMLEDLDRRYAFGNFRNANEPPAVKHLGVERSYMDGPDARAHVSRRG
ncbi:hypothetical protein MMC30_008445 [Trapelia coarctata]|nr:hypothetical protein [Trapelia coarctata]